jgi:dynein heavy chain, axonemal
MTGQINYGGRVTDDLDRVLLMNILAIFQNDDVVQSENFRYSPSGIYYVPKHNSI